MAFPQDPISSLSGVDPKFLYPQPEAWGNPLCTRLTETETCPPPHPQGHPMTCGKEEGQKEKETLRPRAASFPLCLHTDHLGQPLDPAVYKEKTPFITMGTAQLPSHDNRCPRVSRSYRHPSHFIQIHENLSGRESRRVPSPAQAWLL